MTRCALIGGALIRLADIGDVLTRSEIERRQSICRMIRIIGGIRQDRGQRRDLLAVSYLFWRNAQMLHQYFSRHGNFGRDTAAPRFQEIDRRGFFLSIEIA